MSKELVFVYPPVGLGRPGYAGALRTWANQLSQRNEIIDVFEAAQLQDFKQLVIRAGYQGLSYLPPILYKLFHQRINRHDFDSANNDALQSALAHKKVVSISPLTTLMLTAADIPHTTVVGDAIIPSSLKHDLVTRMFLPADLPGRRPQDLVVGGTPLPPGYAEVDWEDRRLHLNDSSGPVRVGFVTHGAGDLGTVLSLIGVQRGLKEKKLHAAFFVGRHTWMAQMLGRLAQIYKNEQDKQLSPGTISIWQGKTLQTALEARSTMLPQVDIVISPTPNEQIFTGPIFVRGVRNDYELANLQYGGDKGWLRMLDSPPYRVWKEISPYFVGGESIAQDMLTQARKYLSFTAGRTIIEQLMQ